MEFYGLCRAKGIETARVAGAVATAGLMMPGAQLLRGHLPSLIVIYVLLKLVFRHGRFTVEGAALTLTGFFYAGLLQFLLSPPVEPGNGAAWLLFLLAANKGSDMAAYVVGKSMGRRKMAPALSPNKTWEGCIGGALGGTGAAVAVLLATSLRKDFAAAPVAALLVFAFLVTMAAQVGDLVESAFKRWAGVKDSGRLLPEFGGMLDMVDSFLVSVPVAHFGALLLQQACS